MPDPTPPPATGDGMVPVADWTRRQQEYLEHSTRTLDRRSLESLTANLVRAGRDPDFKVDAAEFTPQNFRATTTRLDQHLDTSDFDLMRVWVLWRTQGERLSPQTRAALEQRILAFRYWYDDPRPNGMIDHKWFWSENHRIIMHTMEYLAGLSLPEQRFSVTGEPGSVHQTRGRQRIIGWLDEKARWGMSEWHSDVYYPEDIQPLLLLAEFGDPEISARATALLDVLFTDLASNQLDGNFGASHGRSYMKDKSRAGDQNTRDLVHFLFDTNPEGYSEHVDFGALLLTMSIRYRLPAAIKQLAVTGETFTDVQTMGVPLDPTQPMVGTPQPPPGTSFDKPGDLAFWWDRGAMTAWQVVPLSLQVIREQELWRTDLFKPLQPLLRQQGTSSTQGAQFAAYALNCQINSGLLTRVQTVTWRSQHAMLSSAQDYRAGCAGRQYHPWQATLSTDAVVFTSHPGNPDRSAVQGQWADDDLYWNGGSTMPRTAQSGSAVINIFAPRFGAGQQAESTEANYLPMTHAFFPTQHFDEVRQVNGWTLGRRGDGYVALWSQRPTRWAPIARNPAGLTKRFDLIADGGPDNVWISEVGEASRYGDFDNFVREITASRPRATPRPMTGDVPGGFDVTHRSPASGELKFASTGDFTVDGRPVDQHEGPRQRNRFVTSESAVDGGTPAVWHVEIDGKRLDVDLRTGQRTAVG